MFTLKEDIALAPDVAVRVKVAVVFAPAAKIVRPGVQRTLKYEPAFDGLHPVAVIDNVSVTVPVFLM